MINIETVQLQGNGYLLNGTMSVPNDTLNTEYIAIQQWIAQGNTPEPEPIVVVNITSITKLQAMRQLKSMNLWTQFQTMLSSNIDANDEWTLALSLDINDPFVQSLAPALNITADQLQALFNEASKL